MFVVATHPSSARWCHALSACAQHLALGWLAGMLCVPGCTAEPNSEAGTKEQTAEAGAEETQSSADDGPVDDADDGPADDADDGPTDADDGPVDGADDGPADDEVDETPDGTLTEPSCEMDIEYCMHCSLSHVEAIAAGSDDAGDVSTEIPAPDAATQDAATQDATSNAAHGADRFVIAAAGCAQTGDETYTCHCSEESADATLTEQPDCERALTAACELSELDHTSCDQGDLGICERAVEGESTYNCVCPDGSSGVQQDAPSCQAAAFAQCASECESNAGSCSPGEGETYDCECDLYGQRTVRSEGYGCEEELQNTCEPGFGLYQWGPCTNQQGYCDQPDPQIGSWDCSCLDGTSQQGVTPDGEFEEVECGAALNIACPEPPPPPGSRCERTTAAGRVACERSGPPNEASAEAGSSAYFCTCTRQCPDSSSDSASEFDALSCEAALDQTCGQGGPRCD